MREIIMESFSSCNLSIKGLSSVVEALSEVPLPEDPTHLLCVGVWGRLDDESGTLAADVIHTELVGSMPLESTVNEKTGNVELVGVFNPDTHDAFKIPIGSSHNGGMTFQVQCRNANSRAKGSCLMKRAFTRVQMDTFMSEAVKANKDASFAGHCPLVPYGKCIGRFHLDLKHERGRTYIERMKVVIPYPGYEAWIKSLKY